MFLKIRSLWGRNLQIILVPQATVILVGNTEDNSNHNTSHMTYTVPPETTLCISVC